MQVTSAISIAIVSAVPLLFFALLRLRNLGWLKFTAKFLPVPTFTFEISADSRSEEFPPGEDEGKEPTAARLRRSRPG